ncbi:molybdopterin-dependent oxidoreductase [Hydrogenophaga sp. T2]|uniref:molybdopterin-dependent oxidoreductase n=1 Tax=Hydrogenophaga sp. T2 TaxID=3132823 RepID=UPI003CF7AA7F
MSLHPRLPRRGALALGFALAFSTLTAAAQGLPEPKGRVILTVSGQIEQTNRGKDAAFDMAMLEALPQQSFTTRTPWFDKPMKFTGPLLSDVLAAVKAKGQTIKASAINDYTISIPVADAAAHGVIVARLLNDQPMPVREKGPLFVIYPFDSKAELRSSTYYERSIWQLKRMSIE